MSLKQRSSGIDHPGDDTLPSRARRAQALLENCNVCELRCGANRTRNESCPCHLGVETHVYKQYVSLHEDSSLAPTLRVFLAGCNFRCRFCDEGPECFKAPHGERITPDRFAAQLESAMHTGLKTISLIGGEPTLHPHTILATAAAAGRPLPLVVNSNMYMTPEVLDLLDGVVTAYLADLKFGNDACAKQLAGVPRYMEVVSRNLRLAARSTRITARHLLIPGHLDCCFIPVVDWMAENLPHVPFQLYTGYVPCWRASADPLIGRLNTRDETRRAVEYMASRLPDAVLMDDHRWEKVPTALTSTAEVCITIGADGRIYCHDLAPEVAVIVGELCKPGEASTQNVDTGSVPKGCD